jgi:hypothetical protein
MSLFDYRKSIELSKLDFSFYTLIMSAMRKADSDNIEKLKLVFPEVHKEFSERYNAPGGFLKDEK